MTDILDLVTEKREKGEKFALATVIRTMDATAAKAGAKAVIGMDGTISNGWIGGGCARAAVLKAASESMADGHPRLLSVQPGDSLAAQGLHAGEAKDGVEFFKNSCLSQGTMDIFIEPFLPRPRLAICGASPVAVALARLARRLDFFVTVAAPAGEHGKFEEPDRLLDGAALPENDPHADYIVVATQGGGDKAALTAALNIGAPYIAFVGSRKKIGALKKELGEAGISENRLARLHSPAGLDIGAVTPEEIALSIAAELIAVRRRN